MKKLIFVLLIGGCGFVLLALTGTINVPGLTPATPAPEAQKLEPPKDDGAKPAPEAPRPPPERPRDVKPPEAGKVAVAAPTKPKSIYPPITPGDLDRAKALYAKGDFAGVGRSLDGCERAEVEDAATTTAARTLVRKARLLDSLTKAIKLNPLATAKALERVTLDTGGLPVIGRVTESGDQLTILLPGGVETTVAKESVTERVVVTRDALSEKLHQRLKEKEDRIKSDDAFGNYRLGHYCWQYALQVDAMPYLDKAVESDDFPVIARVFGGSSGEKLVDGWYELSGKARPVSNQAVSQSQSSDKRPAAGSPPPPVAASGSLADVIAKTKAKYEEGVGFYRGSFGDSKEASKSLADARRLLKEARDILDSAGENPSGGDSLGIDDLRTQIARLLYDCNKRSSIH
jgi:hypothetical protein